MKDIATIEKEIDEAYAAGNAEIEQLTQALQDAQAKRDETIAALQRERDTIALKIKLAGFPVKLIKSHKVCSVCGATMRPFTVADAEGNVKKLWACSAGNLSELHDLIPVA
jgi:hypothetical protein